MAHNIDPRTDTRSLFFETWHSAATEASVSTVSDHGHQPFLSSPCTPSATYRHASLSRVPTSRSLPPKGCQDLALSNFEQMEDQDETRSGLTVRHLLHVSDLEDDTARSSLVQPHRRHHHGHIVRRAAIVSTLDGALNLRHFHIIASGTPGQEFGWTYGGIPHLLSVRQKHTSRMGAGNAATTANRRFTKPGLRQPRPGDREIAQGGAALSVK
ncbi:hypothetical protein BKA70DRAFT_1562922 [Coprinopsis sp. MPI-PUGE-AT-0042]|nr:hypothetical protein BKA70DRAFT_1562922 [Coprinopsis sp. MPI-PUGE-AT-0042]